MWSTHEEAMEQWYSGTYASHLGHSTNPNDAINFCHYCYEAEQEDFEGQQQAEAHAEDAWLRAAEAGTPDDWAFEQWEAERGLF